jgi:hypothetical protein
MGYPAMVSRPWIPGHGIPGKIYNKEEKFLFDFLLYAVLLRSK